MHSLGARMLAFLAFGLFGDAAAGQEARDMKLEDVGFVMRTANTNSADRTLAIIAGAHLCRAHQGGQALLHLRRS